MITSLVYVSASLISEADESSALSDIVSSARTRNLSLAVTGALVLARSHFAQVLEGDRAAIDELMLSIRRDPRHMDINVVEVSDIPIRRFAAWSLAYVGRSTYIAAQVAPLLPALEDEQRRPAMVHRLLTLLQEFAADDGAAGGAAGNSN